MEQPGNDADAPHPPTKGQPLKTFALAFCGVLLLSFSLLARQQTDRIQQVIVSLFGPPQVEMEEAYSVNPAGPSVDHSALEQLLENHVDADGWVDYESLAKSETGLQNYLDQLAAVPFEGLGRDEKMVVLINASPPPRSE
jgi:hypothetical protein